MTQTFFDADVVAIRGGGLKDASFQSSWFAKTTEHDGVKFLVVDKSNKAKTFLSTTKMVECLMQLRNQKNIEF